MSDAPPVNPNPAPSAVNQPPTNPTPTPLPTPTPDPKDAPKLEPTPAPKPADAPTDTPAPLTDADITLPEGFEVDADAKTKFLELMNDAKMAPKERAQALVDLQTTLVGKTIESIAGQWSAQQEKWQAEVKADPELGGQAYDANLAEVSKLVNTYGGNEAEQAKIRTALDHTGAGNHPEIIRFLFRVAKAVNEPAPISGDPAPTTQSRAEKLFPSMAKKG